MRFQLGMAMLVLLTRSVCAEPACEQAAFAAVVSEAGGALAALNESNKKTFQAKLAALRSRERWTDGEYAAKAATYVKDTTIAALDDRNKLLLEQVPQLGSSQSADPAGGSNLARRCAMVEELRALMAKVIDNTRAKWAYMHGKLDAVLDGTRQAKAAAQ
jgi:hypothetical protein